MKTSQKVKFIVNVIYAAVIVVLCYLALRIADLILPFIIAFILVIILSPVVRWLHRKLHINQKAVSVVTMALLYALAGSLIFWGSSAVIVWLKNLFSELPEVYQNTILPSLNEANIAIENWAVNLSPNLAQVLETVGESLSGSIAELAASLSSKGLTFVSNLLDSLPGFFITLVFTILLSFYISLNYEKAVGFLQNQLPDKWVKKIAEIRSILKNTVLKYARAITILMFITFIELAVGLLIIGVKNPIGKAAGIAIFDALPVFGTGSIMIPWVIIELIRQNHVIATGLAILYAAITVVRNVIEPKVVGQQLGLHPIISLLSIYLGYRLFGIIGMIAFPILAQLLLALHENGTIHLYKWKKTNGTAESDEDSITTETITNPQQRK